MINFMLLNVIQLTLLKYQMAVWLNLDSTEALSNAIWVSGFIFSNPTSKT